MCSSDLSLPSFSRYAKVSSPFLQLAMCPFLESSKKPEEQEEEVPPQEANTGFPFFLLFFFSASFFELSLFLPFFVSVDTSVRNSKFTVPEGVVGSV